MLLSVLGEAADWGRRRTKPPREKRVRAQMNCCALPRTNCGRKVSTQAADGLPEMDSRLINTDWFESQELTLWRGYGPSWFRIQYRLVSPFHWRLSCVPTAWDPCESVLLFPATTVHAVVHKHLTPWGMTKVMYCTVVTWQTVCIA